MYEGPASDLLCKSSSSCSISPLQPTLPSPYYPKPILGYYTVF